MEIYLDLPPHLRVPVAKLRTSSHSLRIEKGRYHLPAALPPDKRSCWFCDDDSIEDELHFLFKCKLYTSLQELTTHCCLLNPSFMHLSDLDKWKFISSCNDNLYHVYEGCIRFKSRRPRARSARERTI